MKLKQPHDFTTREGRQRFYQSSLWRKTRDSHILHNPLCAECLKHDPPVYTPAHAVDHKVDLVDAPHLALTPSNLQSLCQSCHSKKTMAMMQDDLKLKTRKWII